MFALVATSIAGETKKEKREVVHGTHAFSHHEIAHGHAHVTPLTAVHPVHAVHSIPLAQAAPLAQVSGFIHAPVLEQLNAAHLIHPAPAIPIAAAPAIGHHAPIVHQLQPYPVFEKVLNIIFKFHKIFNHIFKKCINPSSELTNRISSI